MPTFLCFSCGKTTVDHCKIKCDHACSHCGFTNIYDIDILKEKPEYAKSLRNMYESKINST